MNGPVKMPRYAIDELGMNIAEAQALCWLVIRGVDTQDCSWAFQDSDLKHLSHVMHILDSRLDRCEEAFKALVDDKRPGPGPEISGGKGR